MRETLLHIYGPVQEALAKMESRELSQEVFPWDLHWSISGSWEKKVTLENHVKNKIAAFSSERKSRDIIQEEYFPKWEHYHDASPAQLAKKGIDVVPLPFGGYVHLI